MSVRPPLRSFSLLFLSVVGVLSVRASAQCATQWLPGPGQPGTNGPVYATTLWDPDGAGPLQPRLVVGGIFTLAGTVAANNIAIWDPASGVWSALGTGTTHFVSALAVLPNGDLVAGGAMLAAGGVSANGIARWNGTSWSALGTGVDGWVGTLAVLPNGDLVAGGFFTTAGAVSANGIARWDGTSWSALGSGMNLNLPVYALAVLPNGDLIAGGDFTIAGGVSANGIARWNGATWSALGSGVGSPVQALVNALVMLPNGDLVAGGQFTTAGGVSVNHIARWDGTSWSALGTGMSGFVYALTTLPNGDAVAVGSFTTAGGVSANHIARWDGTSWSALGAGLGNWAGALAKMPNGDLVAAGQFTTAGGVAVGNLAQLTTTCPATAVSSGAGCTGSGGPNVLTATTLPWTGAMFRSVASGMPGNALVLSALGFATVSIPLSSILPQGVPGCTLFVSPTLLELYLPSAGSVSTQLAIPNTVSLAGQVFHQQVVPVELGAGGITALTSTNALTLTIGSF